MNPVGRVTYLSQQSQNELIAALASETLSTIIDKVKEAKFFSVIVDSTIDSNSIECFVKSEGLHMQAGHRSSDIDLA